MTSTHYLVYGALIFLVLATRFLGGCLDEYQSNGTVTWKTGCIGRRTFIQSVVLGLFAGPAIYLLKGGKEELWWCVVAMMAAPFIVDALRPTVTIDRECQLPQKTIAKLNLIYIVAIVLAAFMLAGLIFVSSTGGVNAGVSVNGVGRGICQQQ
jgi:small-conductance mechanosensitive channel